MGDLERRRAAIIFHQKNGLKISEIFKLLQDPNINYNFVKSTIKRFTETSSIKDKSRSGRPRSKRTPKMLKALKARIRRNPKRTQKKLSLQMKVSKMTMARALKDDLGLRAYKRGKCHMLTPTQKEKMVKRSKWLRRR